MWGCFLSDRSPHSSEPSSLPSVTTLLLAADTRQLVSPGSNYNAGVLKVDTPVVWLVLRIVKGLERVVVSWAEGAVVLQARGRRGCYSWDPAQRGSFMSGRGRGGGGVV